MSGQAGRPQLEPVERCNLCGGIENTLLFPESFDPALNGHDQWKAYRCTHPGYGIHPPIVMCSACGLAYIHPRPRFEAIKNSYESVEDPLYLTERRARELTFRHHLKAFEWFTGPSSGRKLLDVGAYIGVFVEEANKSGWDAWGLEPSGWASGYAREHGLNVERGLLESHPFDSGSFDALTMWDVIEHFTNPLKNLQIAFDLVKPGGWIAVHTMDLDSLFARVMGARWPWLMQMHLYYFTKRTLAEMIEKAGFRVADVRAQGRYLRLGYLMTRLRPYSPLLADGIDRIAALTTLDRLPLPVNFGDLVTAFAQKPG